MPVSIQHRRGTASGWSTANSLLLAGELGVETDTGRVKVGNGSTLWNSLPYINGTTVTVDADGSLVVNGTAVELVTDADLTTALSAKADTSAVTSSLAAKASKSLIVVNAADPTFGTTRDHVQINAALAAVATAGGGKVLVRRADGPWTLNRYASGDQGGSIRITSPNIALESDGADLILAGNCAFFGIGSTLGSQVTITGDVAATDTTIALTSTATFTAGQWAFLRLGQAAYDGAEPDFWLWAKVDSIPDSTHVTLDRPVGYALTVAAVASASQKSVAPVQSMVENVAIDGTWNLINPMSGNANAERGLAIGNARNIRVGTIVATNPGSGAVNAQFTDGLTIQALKVPQSVKQNGAAAKGRIASFAECRAVDVGLIEGEYFEGNPLVTEGRCEAIHIGRLALKNNHPSRSTTAAGLIMTLGNCRLAVDQLHLTGQGSLVSDHGGTLGSDLRMREAYFYTSTRPVGAVTQASDRFVVDNILFTDRKTWRRKIDLTRGMNATFTMPAGYLRRLRTYATTTTGITSLRLGSTGALTNDQKSFLVAGSTVDLAQGRGFGAGFAASIDTGKRVVVTTDSTLPVGSFLIIEADYFADPNANGADDDLIASAGAIAAPSLRAFELVPFTTYGDSYGLNNTAQVSSAADVGTQFADRVAARLRTRALVNNAVPSTRADQIATRALATWTPNSRGLMLLADCVLNDKGQFTTDQTPTTAEAFRAFWATVTSWAILPFTSSAFQFGPGWSSGSGGVGSYVDMAFTGDVAWLGMAFVTGSGGTVTIKNASGSTLATVSTGGYAQPFTGVYRFAGLGSGSRTLRATVTSGTVGIVNLIIPAANAPLGVWVRPGYIPLYDSAGNAAVQSFVAACEAVRADQFPNVLVADLATAPGYDFTTMIGPDQIHLNDKGNGFAADLIEGLLRGRDFGQGLNRLTAPDNGTYVVPALSFVGTGATVPAAPTSVAGSTSNQVALTWVRGGDGGATITSQVIQSSTDGTTWADILTGVAPSAVSAVVTSGLTQGTAYYFRVIGVNSLGRGAASTASSTVTAGAVPTFYSADTFTRADSSSLGSTETGSQAWTTIASTGTFAISGGALAFTTTGSANPPDCYVDDGQANGTFSVTLTAAGGIAGLVTRAAGTNNATGYMFYRTSTGFLFAKRNTAVSYTTLQTLALATGPGDVLTVVWNGTAYTLKLNGATVASGTDASYTGTRHGVWGGAAGQTFDNYSHNNLTTP